MMNKKGVTFVALLWLMALLSLFVLALGVMGNQMNDLYDKNNDLSFGIVTNDTLETMQTYQKTLDTDIKEGQSSYSSLGLLVLTTLPKMIFTVMKMTLDFITGGWIDNAVGLVPLGELSNPIILMARVLFTILIIFIVIKLLTRSST